MRFCWSTLEDKNLEESIRFYVDIIGLDVVSRFSTGSGLSIAFLGDGDTKIELICDGKEENTVVGNDISWGFEVKSLDSALSLINEKGIPIDSGPIQPTPKTKYCFIRDPNGMRIQLVENIT